MSSIMGEEPCGQTSFLETVVLIQRDLSVALNAENDLSALWERLLDAVLKIESIDGASVHLLDHEQRVTTLVATRNLPPKLAAYIDSHDFDPEQADITYVKITRAKDPVYQPLSSFPLLAQENLKTIGLKCLMALPVVNHNDVIAVLNLVSFSEEQTPSWLRIFLEGLTAQIGGAIARIQSLNQLVDSEAAFEKIADELALGENNFKKLFEISPVMMALTDIETSVTLDVNGTYLKQLGFTREEVIGTKTTDLGIFFDPAVREELICIFKEQGFVLDHEVKLRRKLGSSFHGIFSSYIVDLNEGQVVLTTCIDISKRIQAEQERNELQTQLAQAQKMESIGRLAGGVAHDFNNMLSVIQGNTELALKEIEPAQPLFKRLTQINKAVERSAEITRQLLAFARKQTVAPKVIDLNDAVGAMIEMLRRLLGEDIDLAWKPTKKLGAILMDRSQIDQVLVNLCINARDAIPDVGKITIETGNVTFDDEYCSLHVGFIPGEFVFLAVSDNGYGMDKETQTKIFEPFFTTKALGKGTGLGLAMVYGIIKQNKGFINVYSEPNKGASFKIYMPLHNGKEEKATDTEDLVSPLSGGKETILLVEDEPGILEIATMMLEMQGYTILPAVSPAEALSLARTNSGPIDLIITDVVMPNMNGRELTKHLKVLYPDIKCIYMSGYTANVIAHHGVLDEDVHFIEKPFSQKTLVTKVSEVLQQ